MTSLAISVKDLSKKYESGFAVSHANFEVPLGTICGFVGPNGAGKSTLSAALMGKPGYVITGGSVKLDGVDMLALPTWQRATAGLHLIMQYPTEIPGVMLQDAMSAALDARKRDTTNLRSLIATEAKRISFDTELVDRAVNVDFSGGEKKRNETVQLAVLQPKIAILDELDSGLDIDALRDCAQRVEDATREMNLGVLVITHYSRLFEQLKPDFVHILTNGRIVKSAGPELADELEVTGYAAYSN